MLELFIILFFTLLTIEIIIKILVKVIKKDFQWLVTKEDDFPKFEKKNTIKFFKKSFNKKLGWLKKTNIHGYEKLNYKKTKFSIDKNGRRKSNYNHFRTKIEAYGDSYVFGRFSQDDKVWTEHLSKKLKSHIKNYGVGNYGFDQAYLRYKNNIKDKKSKIVIIGFVPETINRIQSIWKHYLEFGNIYGFKPRYIIKNKEIKLLNNPISNIYDFKKIKNIIKKINSFDKFYLEKFKKFQFRFPYTLSFIRNFNFNSKLFSTFIINSILQNKLNKKKKLFPLYYINNIESANKLYGISDSKLLFKNLIYRFRSLAKKRGSKPVLIVFPQKFDIYLYIKNKSLYGNFFSEIKNLKIIDLTNFLSKKNLKKIYLNEDHGGHFSSYGNKIVAQKIYEEIKNV